MLNKEDIRQKLGAIINPHTNQSFAEDKSVRQFEWQEDGVLQVTLSFGYPVKLYQAFFTDLVVNAFKGEIVAEKIQVHVEQNILAHQVQTGVQTIPNVSNIIAIASGKGGVGKSTTATNLALTLSQMGARVGVLDADIYGPSQPTMLGVAVEHPEQIEGMLKPVMAEGGVQVMSIGFLIDENQAVVWRGPLLSQVLQQLLFQTQWDELDYLLIDLPPGTGDIQLTLSQKIPVTAAVVVTTPQDIALIDARKAIDMFRKVAIPVAGILENMSIHICSQCGHQEAIFGEGGGEELAELLDIPLLGKLPLNRDIRLAMDEGKALSVLLQKNKQISEIYQSAALQLAISISKKSKDYSSKMPKIIVE